MGGISPLLLSIVSFLPASDASPSPPVDLARLREVLQDRQYPRNQSQAALLIVQNQSPEAEAIVRQGLRQTDAPERFFALAAAIRLTRDRRFTDELLAAFTDGQTGIRQSAADTLADLADDKIVQRFQVLIEDPTVDRAIRLMALRALGRSAKKAATVVFLGQLSNADEGLRQAAAEALRELTGQTFGSDLTRWRAWWEAHKSESNEQWLEERLAFQASRARRIEGELELARTQLIRLHQQLYARLPPGDKLGHVQGLADAEDAAVRLLAITWSVELLSAVDAVGQRALEELLLRFSHDSTLDVQRSATLALGRIRDARAFDRLQFLVQHGPDSVRGAAARALALQVRASGSDALACQRQVVPVLQKALDDPALEVVVEAAEGLGTLGVPEAGPVLTVLLRHSSQPVRQTAALALERVADLTSLDGLLEALNDQAVAVRFSLVGALSHAVGEGRAPTDQQRTRLLMRLEELLLRDADPGVRSRAATVLGECGSATILPLLWGRVLALDDNRVQEKAWSAIIEIVARSTSLDLIHEWDRRLVDAKQGARRLQLLGEVYSRWQKREETKTAAAVVLELLVQAQLEQAKWAAAFPLLRELLARPANDAEIEKRLRWLLQAGEQALKEGNRPEALRIVQEAQAYLPRRADLAADFEKLEKQTKP